MTLSWIGILAFRDRDDIFGVRAKDRFSHLYAIGKTGTGKSTLLRTLATQDLGADRGFALLDPHGDLAESLLYLVPRRREEDLIYLDLPAGAPGFHLNPLSAVPAGKVALAVAGLVETMKKIWDEDWGPRLEHLLRNVLFTLLALPEASLADIPRLLSDRRFREAALRHVENEEVLSFWRDEYARYSPAFRAVVAAPLQNKIGAFLSDPLLKRVLSGPSTLDLRTVMDEGKVLLVNLSRGEIGEGPAQLLGSLLVSSIALQAFSRAELPEEKRRPFFLYLDEFHNFATLSLATMLSELRKYRVGLILANQYLGQLSPELRDAVIGNTGTLISFRVGASDAAFLAREFSPVFSADDLLALPNYHIYLKLLIDGEPSRPFSARTIIVCE